MRDISLSKLIIGIKGAGEMATAVAHRLYKANFRNIYMMDIKTPMAVRRTVCFSESIFEGSSCVEGVDAVLAYDQIGIINAWKRGQIPTLADPEWKTLSVIPVHVLIDAILAKKNIGTACGDAPLVIGIGPGFTAGVDVHLVVESNRGHHLGRIIEQGSAEANTGVPGEIKGYAVERVFRAPCSGIFLTHRSIGECILQGEPVGSVENQTISASISGVIRGLLRTNTPVTAGLKLGDIDPRGVTDYCYTISDKARAIAGAVLEAILRRYNIDCPKE